MDEQQVSQMLPIGTTLQEGRYSVVRYIASGGFGNTYEVEDHILHQNYAMKEFFMRGINQRKGTQVTVSQEENRSDFDKMSEKFHHEAQRLAGLEEPHIVGVINLFKENQTAYYVMRLIDGSSLSARLFQQGHPFTEQQVRDNILPQILSALKYVHKKNLCHLDLKPGNIMMDNDGHCWLIDFGASKQMSAAESQTLSTSTGLCYTPGFAPSEQINGNAKRIGPSTDIYALGATLYNLLTAKTPPSSDDIMNEGASAFTFPSAVSEPMRQLIIWMMNPAVNNRPKSIEEIELRLATKPGAEVSFDTIKAKPQTTPTSVETKLAKPVPTEPTKLASVDSKPKRSRLGLMAAVAGALALLVVGGILMFLKPTGDTTDDSESADGINVINSDEPGLVVGIGDNGAIVQRLIDNMVRVEGGTFQMGSASPEGLSDEQPVHTVTLSTFSIGRYEVTQEEWEAVMGINPSDVTGSNRPVEQVSWDDCQEFISKLNELTGQQFRLPTEAEWEFAASGGNHRDGYLYAGSSSLGDVGWYEGNSNNTTHDVGQKTPNSLGLYDMSGNVWEWCQDWYGPYSGSEQANPTGSSSASCRVYRGGGWGNNATGCRVSRRNIAAPSYRYGCLGLRLAAH